MSSAIFLARQGEVLVFDDRRFAKVVKRHPELTPKGSIYAVASDLTRGLTRPRLSPRTFHAKPRPQSARLFARYGAANLVSRYWVDIAIREEPNDRIGGHTTTAADSLVQLTVVTYLASS